MLELGFGLTFHDLYSCAGLRRVDAAFGTWIEHADAALAARLAAARADPAALTTAMTTFRRRQASTAVTNTVGNIHTQWCDHDTGETTSPNSAIQITAKVGSLARSTRRAAHTVSASTSKQAATQGRKRSCSPRPNRASARPSTARTSSPLG